MNLASKPLHGTVQVQVEAARTPKNMSLQITSSLNNTPLCFRVSVYDRVWGFRACPPKPTPNKLALPHCDVKLQAAGKLGNRPR